MLDLSSQHSIPATKKERKKEYLLCSHQFPALLMKENVLSCAVYSNSIFLPIITLII